MKRTLNVLIRIFYIIPPVLLLFGCVTAPKIPMQTPVKELSQVDPGRGIVVGSVLVRGAKRIFATKMGWTLYATNASEYWNPENEVYEIKGLWGEEQIFVMKMPAGVYYFTKLDVRQWAYLDECFTVRPGKTVYIGRLVIQFLGRHLIKGSSFLWKVEDAKEDTLAAAEKTYGNLVRNAITDLMGRIRLPQTFQEVQYFPGPGEKLPSFWRYPTGTLTIGKDAIEFRSREQQLTIPYSSVVDVRYGRPKRHVGFASWAIVRFRAGGSEKDAAFNERRGRKGALYRTLKKLFTGYYGPYKGHLGPRSLF